MRKQNATRMRRASGTEISSLTRRRIKKGRPVYPPPLEPFRLRRFNRTRRRNVIHRLLGCSLRDRKNRYEGAAGGFCTKLDAAFDLGEEGMISAHSDIKAVMPCGAALTRNDVARNHVLAAIGFDSEPFARRVASVAR